MTCDRSIPCGAATRDLRSGSGLTANRTNLPNASELYPAFDLASRSPRPALCYRPLLALPVHFHERVTTLEPRNAAPTGKTLEVVKERFCLYAFYFYSQHKIAVCNHRVFSQVHAVHRRMTGIGAGDPSDSVARSKRQPFPSTPTVGSKNNSVEASTVKNAQKQRPAKNSPEPPPMYGQPPRLSGSKSRQSVIARLH